jgi:hypothetical protein
MAAFCLTPTCSRLWFFPRPSTRLTSRVFSPATCWRFWAAAAVWLPVVSEPWIEASIQHFVLAVAAIAGSHLALRSIHRRIIQDNCNLPGLEDDEEDFPMKLGLRY